MRSYFFPLFIFSWLPFVFSLSSAYFVCGGLGSTHGLLGEE